MTGSMYAAIAGLQTHMQKMNVITFLFNIFKNIKMSLSKNNIKIENKLMK